MNKTIIVTGITDGIENFIVKKSNWITIQKTPRKHPFKVSDF
ncbi:hypothetical protein [Psychroserpens luteus]|nr:hypothetical protein [Psychroserpens luteus]